MICKPKVRSYLGVCQSYATDCHNDHCVSQEHRAHLLSTSQAVKKPLASTQNSSQDAFLGASYSPDRLQLTSLPCKKKLSLVNPNQKAFCSPKTSARAPYALKAGIPSSPRLTSPIDWASLSTDQQETLGTVTCVKHRTPEWGPQTDFATGASIPTCHWFGDGISGFPTNEDYRFSSSGVVQGAAFCWGCRLWLEYKSSFWGVCLTEGQGYITTRQPYICKLCPHSYPA